MTYFHLIRKNILHYWKRNLALAMGVAISTAVITGALMVGDSVKGNLNKGVDLRLGAVTHTVQAGDRFFTEELAKGVETELSVPVAPLLLLEGMAITDGGKKRINKIQVVGVSQSIDQALKINSSFKNLSDEEVVISANLASRLSLKVGDQILLRIKKASLIPLNTPFVSDEANTVPVMLNVKAVAGDHEMGRFNLRISQTAPFNAFVSIGLLNKLMNLKERANVLLITGSASLTKEKIDAAIQKSWSLADMNLNLKTLPSGNTLQLTSERVFIEPTVVDAIKKITVHQRYVITYFVNSFSSGSNSTPYSFVSTLPDNRLKSDEIIINKWLAEDLKAKTGDQIDLKYFVVGPLKELTEKKASFRVKSIVDIEGEYADKELIPNLPGLTDAGNCRDWDTGVPIDLKKIRPKDEAYWNKWKGTPKAFIADSKGVELWKNRFGTYTAVRIGDASEASSNPDRATTKVAPTLDDQVIKEVGNDLKKSIDPALLGFVIDPVRENGKAAAQNGLDFSQLFSGLSFFILVAGIVLIMLLFLLNMESRQEQLKTLSFLGIGLKKIRKVVLSEVLIVAFAGTIVGTGLAYGYCLSVFSALNNIWNDAVRTEMMDVVVNWQSLLSGMVIGLTVTGITVYFSATHYLRKQEAVLKKNSKAAKTKIWRNTLRIIAPAAGSISLGLILTQIIHLQSVNPTVFFTAGGLLLVSLLFYTGLWLNKIKNRTSGQERRKAFDVVDLCFKNVIRNKNRSLNIVILFAIGTFIVISTGANRQDLFVDAGLKSSGTGGFQTYAESTVPVVKDLNNPLVRKEFELTLPYPIVQLMKHEGDDASCLNLNRVTNPSILGVKSEQLNNRFSFVSTTPLLNKANPWSSLDQRLAGGVIPAIADETVIKWGLGMEVGDTLVYKNENGEKMKLKLIGGLANSLFQGHIIISQKYFMANFPSGSGSTLFLIDNQKENQQVVEDELKHSFRDYGWEVIPAAQKLAEFNSIENTYLSIFLVLGAFGLLIGTVGLGVILVRSILERRGEIALLKAVGYSRKLIFRMFVNEYTALLFAGIVTGSLTATIAILPSLISPNTGISFSSIGIILTLLFVNGLFWITLLTRLFLHVDRINEALRNE